MKTCELCGLQIFRVRTATSYKWLTEDRGWECESSPPGFIFGHKPKEEVINLPEETSWQS